MEGRKRRKEGIKGERNEVKQMSADGRAEERRGGHTKLWKAY